jgi:hypothetical protein
VTAKQRVVLGALRDAQHEQDGQAASAGQIAAACPAPWNGRPDLVTQALWLLHAHGLVLARGRLDARMENHRRWPADARTSSRASS